jgi:hypothetical protein
MSRSPLQLKGIRFGSLKVLCVYGQERHGILWLCRCDCGQLRAVTAGRLHSGETRCCRECARRRMGKRRRVADTVERNRQIATEFAAGERVVTIARRHRVSLTNVYRIVQQAKTR